MALISWDDSFSVGYADIDAQHRQLVEMINELHAAMAEMRNREALGEVLMKMFGYAQTHFQKEEEYFAEYDYTGAEEHNADHAAFISKVFRFLTEFKEGREDLSEEVMGFLSEWLINHIKGTDAKYKGCLE